MLYAHLRVTFMPSHGLYVRSDGLISFDGVRFYTGDKFDSTRSKPNAKPKHYFRVTHLGIESLIHRLVAECFCENPSPKHFHIVDHIDGNGLNNASWNLRWVNSTLNNLGNMARNTQPTKSGKYQGRVKVNKHPYYTKSYNTEYEAHLAAIELKYDLFKKEYNDKIEHESETTRYCQHLHGGEWFNAIRDKFDDTDLRRPRFYRP